MTFLARFFFSLLSMNATIGGIHLKRMMAKADEAPRLWGRKDFMRDALRKSVPIKKVPNQKLAIQSMVADAIISGLEIAVDVNNAHIEELEELKKPIGLTVEKNAQGEEVEKFILKQIEDKELQNKKQETPPLSDEPAKQEIPNLKEMEEAQAKPEEITIVFPAFDFKPVEATLKKLPKTRKRPEDVMTPWHKVIYKHTLADVGGFLDDMKKLGEGIARIPEQIRDGALKDVGREIAEGFIDAMEDKGCIFE